MEKNGRTITLTLTPSQFDALSQFAEKEGSDLASLANRGVDTLLATYAARNNSALEAKIDKLHDHMIKLMVSLMKLVGQAIYFSSLPLTAGPVKARLNQEGVSIQWHQSEKFAVDLLKPPASITEEKIRTL
jgi:hypothetical protein